MGRNFDKNSNEYKTSKHEKIVRDQNDDILKITAQEIHIALQNVKNGRGSEKDRIILEILKMEKDILHKPIRILFSKCNDQGKIRNS